MRYTLPFLLCCIGTVVGSSLTIIWQLDRATVRYASMRTVQIKYIHQNCCSEKFVFLTIRNFEALRIILKINRKRTTHHQKRSFWSPSLFQQS